MTTVIDQDDLKKKLEAILFAAGRKVELEELARLLHLKDLELIRGTLEALKHGYDSNNSPLLLTTEGAGWKLTVREKYLPLVREISPHTELAKALLETLAVVAWKQPVLQSDVIKIRSSAAYEHLATLLELGFINREKKGRSYILKVTGKFFDYFDLPEGQQSIAEVFKDVASAAEALQQQLGQKGEQKTFGTLPVYEAGVAEAEKPEHPAEEKLGALDVYDEPAETQQDTDAEKTAEEEHATQEEQETSEQEEPTMEEEKTEEEKKTETQEDVPEEKSEEIADNSDTEEESTEENESEEQEPGEENKEDMS